MRSRQQRAARSALTYAHSSFNDEWQNHSVDILGENVELDVHWIARLRSIEVGVLFRVRHNPSDETIGKNFGDRKADSIESDRAFGSHIMRELSWQLDFQSKIRPAFLEGDDR